MGTANDDAVSIEKGKKAAEPYVITVNCPDKTGLSCDISHTILEFDLLITRGGQFHSFPLLWSVYFAMCSPNWILFPEMTVHLFDVLSFVIMCVMHLVNYTISSQLCRFLRFTVLLYFAFSPNLWIEWSSGVRVLQNFDLLWFVNSIDLLLIAEACFFNAVAYVSTLYKFAWNCNFYNFMC